MFCPKCGSIMMTNKCSCGYKTKDGSSMNITEKKEQTLQKVEVVDPEVDDKTLPKTKEECPKCENQEAYFWEIQTRAGDEPATKFLKCTKCKHIWRDYS